MSILDVHPVHFLFIMRTDTIHNFPLHRMSWNIANAKQQFSEVVRLCAEEPQPVFNRSRQVAVVVSAEEYAAFSAWRTAQQAPATLDVAGLFGEARQALKDLGLESLELPQRTNRPEVDFGPRPDHATQ